MALVKKKIRNVNHTPVTQSGWGWGWDSAHQFLFFSFVIKIIRQMMFSVIIFQIEIVGGVGDEFFS